MKLCPNCQFENFENIDTCHRCKSSINAIKDEKFQMFEFIKMNSAIYVVIGVLLAFVNYSSKDVNSLRTGTTLVSAFLAILLLLLLTFKSLKYRSQIHQDLHENLEIFTYIFINMFFIFAIFLFYDITYLPIFALFGGIFLGLIIPSKIRDPQRATILILIICIELLILIYLSTKFIWDLFPDLNKIEYVMIASSILFFSIGGVMASMIVVYFIVSNLNKKFDIFEFIEGLKHVKFGIYFQLIIGFLILFLIIYLPMFLV